ncbi:hypothetical protein DESC_780334 [Desulfosarcina cetonica]|nr:hypothetical protein DESC_780334 [Desulfosarcina cetonica]
MSSFYHYRPYSISPEPQNDLTPDTFGFVNAGADFVDKRYIFVASGRGGPAWQISARQAVGPFPRVGPVLALKLR